MRFWIRFKQWWYLKYRGLAVCNQCARVIPFGEAAFYRFKTKRWECESHPSDRLSAMKRGQIILDTMKRAKRRQHES